MSSKVLPVMNRLTKNMRGQRVLITGGLGFIGSNLARRCLGLGAKVTVYDCLDPRSGGNMHNIHDIQSSLNLIVDDIRNFQGVSACVRHQDLLFNCAAFTSHPNSMREPLTDADVNCKGVINLLEACRLFNPSIKFINIGTSTQIGRMCKRPISECHPEFPLDIYSANKSAGEKYVLIYGKAYQMWTTVVRLANVFGPRSNIKSPDFGFLNYFIGLAMQGKEINVFGDGSQLRNVTYVDDCVDALILAAQNDRSNGHVFFAVSNNEHTVAELACHITRIMGGKTSFVEWPKDRAVLEIGNAVFTNQKIKSTLGWSAVNDLESGLIKTKKYFASCLDRYLD